MVSEELVDACLCVVFDFPVVGIVDRLEELAEVAEAVVVVGEPMADERPGGQLSAFLQRQRAGPSDAAAAHDGGMLGDTVGNLRRQTSVPAGLGSRCPDPIRSHAPTELTSCTLRPGAQRAKARRGRPARISLPHPAGAIGSGHRGAPD